VQTPHAGEVSAARCGSKRRELTVVHHMVSVNSNISTSCLDCVDSLAIAQVHLLMLKQPGSGLSAHSYCTSRIVRGKHSLGSQR